MSAKKFGNNLNWFLSELASFEDIDIEGGEIEIHGEDKNGNEGSIEVSITELAAAALEEITQLKNVMIEAQRLIKNGANGAIVDTVWSDSRTNQTLYELLYEYTGELV